MIEFHCPGCGQEFRAGDHLAGKRSRYMGCGAITRDHAPVASTAPTPARRPRPAAREEIPVAEPMPRLAPRPTAAPESEAPRRRRRRRKRDPGKLDRDAWVALGIGAGLAGLALAVPLLGFVIDVLKTLIHELGHTAAA